MADQQPNKPTAAEKRAEAKAHGFESVACRECGHFTLVRAGVCQHDNQSRKIAKPGAPA